MIGERIEEHHFQNNSIDFMDNNNLKILVSSYHQGASIHALFLLRSFPTNHFTFFYLKSFSKKLRNQLIKLPIYPMYLTIQILHIESAHFEKEHNISNSSFFISSVNTTNNFYYILDYSNNDNL
jgi:hypothetical protein